MWERSVGEESPGASESSSGGAYTAPAHAWMGSSLSADVAGCVLDGMEVMDAGESPYRELALSADDLDRTDDAAEGVHEGMHAFDASECSAAASPGAVAYLTFSPPSGARKSHGPLLPPSDPLLGLSALGLPRSWHPAAGASESEEARVGVLHNTLLGTSMPTAGQCRPALARMPGRKRGPRPKVFVCVRARACARVRVCVCVRACVRACE